VIPLPLVSWLRLNFSLLYLFVFPALEGKFSFFHSKFWRCLRNFIWECLIYFRIKMKSEGLESLFPIEDISVMGIWELLPHLYRIKVSCDEYIVNCMFGFIQCDYWLTLLCFNITIVFGFNSWEL
jgi:hypothetical protein